MQDINEIDDLIKIISKLPGLGPKSAKRIVLKLINNRDELVKPMANTLAQVYKNVTRCNSCGSLKSNINGCMNCEINIEKFNEILGNSNYAYDVINDVEIKLSENISVPAKSAIILELISK